MFAFERIVVVAPTRSTCVNLHSLLGRRDDWDTLIMSECGEEVQAAIRELPQGGFGIVAGTGTGKSVAIREVCRKVLDSSEFQVGIVTQEHQRDDKTSRCQVLVITPGVAVQWAKKGLLSSKDLIVLDEVHQTSEHLELAMALLKLRGCTFAWMSATIDPAVYEEYLEARRVIQCTAYDASRRADIFYDRGTVDGLLRRNIRSIISDQRGVAVFVPTRAEAEEIAREYGDVPGLYADFYHGGEPAEKLRRYIEGDIPRPFVIAMTSAGASSLNIKGLNTVVIVDAQYTDVVHNGRRQRERRHLDTNTLLQMAGRVDGRAIGGQVHIVTSRNFDFRALTPVTPAFKLGGDLGLLALVSAGLEIDARDLPLIGGLDEYAYKAVFDKMVERGIISTQGGVSLTDLGRRIEPLPVPAAWGEVVVRAQKAGLEDLLNVVCLTACTGELYQLTGQKWKKDVDPCVVRGSDHLTAYNIVATALRDFGRISGDGKGYRFDREFARWCGKYGYSQKEIRNVALLVSSLFRQLKTDMPAPSAFPQVARGDELHQMFIELLAATQSMEYVREGRYRGRAVYGNQKQGVSTGQSVLGAIRYWTDANQVPRATVEGTEIPDEVLVRYAQLSEVRVSAYEDDQLTLRADMTFAGEHVEWCQLTIADTDLPPALEKILGEWMQLNQTARGLRDEINRLLFDHKDVFSDELFQQLDSCDVDDGMLPLATSHLEAWAERAEALVAKARKEIRPAPVKAAKSPAASAPQPVEVDVAKLVARFNSK